MSRSALLLLLVVATATTARAQLAGNPLPAVRANQWALAQTQAATDADPVAAKLVLFYRLLDPGAATPTEIAAFMHDNPDWPDQGLLRDRWQQAVAADPDDGDVLRQCAAGHPTEAPTLLRCAQALAAAGNTRAAAADARRAWRTGVVGRSAEAAFLHRWGGDVTARDQWARFRYLAWHAPSAAVRQVGRLDPQHRKLAEARLALQHDASDAPRLLAAVPAALRHDPGLMLDQAGYLRRADRLAAAVALWRKDGAAAQAADPAHLTAFWAERSRLARQLLARGDAADAYALVCAHGQRAPATVAAAEFLAGFIALRLLHDPAAATTHFRILARSHAAITQARAQYWLGRAAAAAGKDATPFYRRAAAWPTTFYGQLAALALGDNAATLAAHIRAMHDPGWTRKAVQAFTGHEVLRAAAWLVAWDAPRRARAFLLRMEQLAPDSAERALTAQFALRVGLPDVAVFVGRRMGFDGRMLPRAGWPMPFDPPADGVDPAVALAVMRQESSFNPDAVSPSGARGLMQLMPPTARQVARQLGVRTSLVALTADPRHNMRLGTGYLRDMLTQFDGSLPLAVAAYNAGPHRVAQWLATNGDPRTGAVDMLDWLELIPSAETRNYVQRVLESVVIYRARLGETTPTLPAAWAH